MCVLVMHSRQLSFKYICTVNIQQNSSRKPSNILLADMAGNARHTLIHCLYTEILTEIYTGHPYLITALFEIRPVAYFGIKENTFDQKTISFLLQYGVTFWCGR